MTDNDKDSLFLLDRKSKKQIKLIPATAEIKRCPVKCLHSVPKIV